MNLILTRHTKTDDNANKIYSGQNDVPLNGLGLIQADTLREKLAGISIAQIWCSDLRRSKMTVAPLAEQCGIIPQADSRLREVHIGRLSGMAKERVLKQYPQREFDLKNPNFDFRSVGGESADEVFARHMSFLRGVVRGGSSGWAVVCGHGSAMRLLLQRHSMAFAVTQGDYMKINSGELGLSS